MALRALPSYAFFLISWSLLEARRLSNLHRETLPRLLVSDGAEELSVYRSCGVERVSYARQSQKHSPFSRCQHSQGWKAGMSIHCQRELVHSRICRFRRLRDNANPRGAFSLASTCYFTQVVTER